jgi:hypothetical protein
MRLCRFRLRTMMVAVAVLALVLGGILWIDRLRRFSAYYHFVARAYEVEAKAHSVFVNFYNTLAEQRRRPNIRLSREYQDIAFFSNDWGGRLTTARQDEWWPYATRFRNPDPEQDVAELRALAVREQNRSAYFAHLVANYRRAARYPWLPIKPDPAPPE